MRKREGRKWLGVDGWKGGRKWLGVDGWEGGRKWWLKRVTSSGKQG